MSEFGDEAPPTRKRSDTVGMGVPNPAPIVVSSTFEFGSDDQNSPVLGRSRSGTTSSAGVHAAALQDEESRENRMMDLRRRAMSVMVTDGNYDQAPVDYSLDNLFENNVKWAQKVSSKHPEFFSQLAQAQHPEYLWYAAIVIC